MYNVIFERLLKADGKLNHFTWDKYYVSLSFNTKFLENLCKHTQNNH